MAEQMQKIISVSLKADQAIEGIQRLNQGIEKNNSIVEQNKAEIKSLNKAMEQEGADATTLKNRIKDLQNENEHYNNSTKELQRNKRELQKEVQNEIRQQRELDGSLRQLRAELSNLTKEYDALGRVERETGTRGKELKQQINAVTAEIKLAEQGTDRYYRNVGNYQQSILNAIGLNGRFGQSIVNITNNSTSISQGFSAMGASVKGFGASLMTLMSNPVFLALAGIAGAGLALKWFWDYNNNIAEANRLTREFTGLQGDELVALRNSIQATSDVMGKDFKDTLKTADTLMSQFHISGEEAMNVINKGFASGADVNGDMLQKLQQYAPTFHDAGIEAEQMMAIISQTKSGIFSEQGLEAIKQGSARIREMSSSTRKALQGVGIDVDQMQEKMRNGSLTTFDAVKQVSSAIKELPDNAQEVGEVMSAVFGRQGKFASQEMIESLATMSTSLDEVTAKTGEYGELLLENINTEEELDAVTAALFDMSDKGWEEAKQKATIFAKKALVDVVKGLMDVVNWFIRLYNQSIIVRGAVQYIILGFKTMWSAIKFVFGRIVDGVKQMGRAFEALANIIEGVFSLDANRVYEGWRKAEQAFKKGWENLANASYDWGKEVAGNAIEAYNNTIDTTPIKELSISASSIVGGGSGTSNGGGGGGGRSNGSKQGGKGGKSGTNKKTTTDTKKERDEELERQKKLLQDLLKQSQDLEKKAMDEQAKISVEGIMAKYKAQEDAIKSAYSNLNKLTTEEQEQAQKIINKLIENNSHEQALAIQGYYEAERAKRLEEQKKSLEQAKQLVDVSLEASEQGTDVWLKWRLEQLRLAMEAELQMVGNNSELRNAIIAKYEKQATQIYQEQAQAQMEIERTKYDVIATIAGGLSDVVGQFADKNKEMAVMEKTLALAQIMISQAVAIANAVKAGSNATNPWQMIAQIATSVTAVITAMASAFKSLNSAKFATGGYISGAGTATSDSIPIRVSNGESVMNANTTAMFSGLLSSLNQLGGGVPIQVSQTAQSVRGEDMLARAVARGVAMLPAPVVSVQDINRGQRQVAVMDERATI